MSKATKKQREKALDKSMDLVWKKLDTMMMSIENSKEYKTIKSMDYDFSWIVSIVLRECISRMVDARGMKFTKEELNKMLLDTANDRVIQAKEDREQATIN
tara:strand:+ start:690 stop:992 length:303 start_codon:yes stop_codon:yes gene_type:complete